MEKTSRDDFLEWICGFANAFFRAGMIEAWGRGIELIMESCRSALVPIPLIRFEQTGLWVEFHFNPIKTETEKGPTTQETTQEKIVSLLRSNPSLTRKALTGLIGLSEEGFNPKSPVGSRDSTEKAGLFSSQKSLSVVPATACTFLFAKRPAFSVSVLAPNWEFRAKYHLNKLKLSGRVKRKGSTKSGQWEVLE